MHVQKGAVIITAPPTLKAGHVIAYPEEAIPAVTVTDSRPDVEPLGNLTILNRSYKRPVCTHAQSIQQ